ncbi:MAG: SDR family oxidoreductase [Actinomycetales bacterium]
MSDPFDYSDTTVVVVGGTSGINRGIAELFAAHGARVAVASRSQEKVDQTVEALRGYGGQAMGFAADVREASAIKDGLGSVHEEYGDFDVLVSGAAGNFPATAIGMSANAFRSVIEIDLLGSFHVVQGAYPYLRKPGASVINISAPQAFVPMNAQAHVCSAKAGVDMITRCLALEWGPAGIRVNSVVPGPIEGTEGMRRLGPTPEAMDRFMNSVPLRRLGTPQDIGNACLFLASEYGSYISGAVLPVDGGWAQTGAQGMADALADI